MTHNLVEEREIQKTLKMVSLRTTSYQINKLVKAGIITINEADGIYYINEDIKLEPDCDNTQGIPVEWNIFHFHFSNYLVQCGEKYLPEQELPQPYLPLQYLFQRQRKLQARSGKGPDFGTE